MITSTAERSDELKQLTAATTEPKQLSTNIPPLYTGITTERIGFSTELLFLDDIMAF